MSVPLLVVTGQMIGVNHPTLLNHFTVSYWTSRQVPKLDIVPSGNLIFLGGGFPVLEFNNSSKSRLCIQSGGGIDSGWVEATRMVPTSAPAALPA
jgi:hypothetical protein